MAEMIKTFNIGIVVVGRNEGIRLNDCLKSLPMLPIVYVDSGSTDNSLNIAQSNSIDSIVLEKPYTAAKARNEGALYLLNKFPQISAIQFIDGDCILIPGWLETASAALDNDPNLASTYGNIVEEAPFSTIYNRLLSMEWKDAPGISSHFPGITTMRASSWEKSGGYNESIIAGEDSEFSLRIRLQGEKILRLDHDMVYHHGSITNFWQWWKRSVRSGHAAAERYALHGKGTAKECRREVMSIVLWGGFLPIAILLLTVFFNKFWLLLSLLYVVLACKVMLYRKRKLNDSFQDSCLYAFFCVLGKIPSFIGISRFVWNRIRNTQSTIIEYK